MAMLLLLLCNLLLSLLLFRGGRCAPRIARCAEQTCNEDRVLHAVFVTHSGQKFHGTSACPNIPKATDASRERVKTLSPCAVCFGRVGVALGAKNRNETREEE